MVASCPCICCTLTLKERMKRLSHSDEHHKSVILIPTMNGMFILARYQGNGVVTHLLPSVTLATVVTFCENEHYYVKDWRGEDE